MRSVLSFFVVLSAMAVSAIGSAAGVENPRIQMILDSAYNRMNEQADIWYETGDFPRVVQLLRVQAELFPNDYDVITNLGWMLESIEEYPEALAVYIKYRKNNPDDPDAALPEATFYSIRRAFAKVPPILEPAIKTKKKKPHANVYRLLATAYERMHLLEDAKRVYLAHLEIDPNDPNAKRKLENVEKKIRGEIPLDPKPTTGPARGG